MIETTALRKVLVDSLYRDEEVVQDHRPPPDAVLAEGVTHTFAFHPQRLEKHRGEVRNWLMQLSPTFFPENHGGGGGWSFLQAPFLANGEQWGEQPDAESLLCLGIGLGYVTSQLPRELWEALPGGVPYYIIDVGQ